jgi:hypothetical protein
LLEANRIAFKTGGDSPPGRLRLYQAIEGGNMALRTKIVTAVVALMIAATATVAVAEPGITVSLVQGLTQGYYGQDLMLMPRVNTELQAVPGAGLAADKVEFEYCDNGEWTRIGDADQVVEETGTIEPLILAFDDTFRYPADFRAKFYRQSKDASGVAGYRLISVSDTVTVDARQYPLTKLVAHAPKTAKRNRAFAVDYSVVPNVGTGNLVVKTYKRAGSRWVAKGTKTIALDESASASAEFTFAAAGSYRIVARFPGSQWGVAAPSVVSVVSVR